MFRQIFVDGPSIRKIRNRAGPLQYVQPRRLLPDTDLIEYVCAENAKEVFRAR